jgi:hypothetical protein
MSQTSRRAHQATMDATSPSGRILNAVNNRESNSQSIPIWLPTHNTKGMSVVFIAINVKALVNNTTVQLVITRALEGSP